MIISVKYQLNVLPLFIYRYDVKQSKDNKSRLESNRKI